MVHFGRFGSESSLLCHAFTFMHLTDAFIQRDLQYIQVIHFLGTEPTTFALLMQCSTTEPQEHVQDECGCGETESERAERGVAEAWAGQSRP